MRVENQMITLRLNAGWNPIGYTSIKDAIIALNSVSPNGENAAIALDIEYKKDQNGLWDFDNPLYINPVKWADWLGLKIRDFDLVIRTTKLSIRAPTVIISPGYNKMPFKYFRPTPSAIRERDKDTCQVSGKKLKWGEGNVDHLTPKSRGGRDTFENLIYIDKRLNFLKGDKTLQEMGWGLIQVPKAPLPRTASSLITEAKNRDWRHFLIKTD